MKKHTEEMRKITVNLPAKLLRGLGENGENLTDTIREALKAYRHRQACQALLALRGKVKFDMTYEEMKEDRE